MLKNLLLIIFCCGAFTFSAVGQVELMSYNVRYANENDGENSWSLRKDHITTQIKWYRPDIMGVQEAVYEQVEHFKNALENYVYVGVGRDDGKTGGEFSAIYFNTERFQALEQDTFWLSETPEKVSVGWDAALPRVCTYVKLKDITSGDIFWVFNTHFDHIGELARQESAKLIYAKIEELNPENLPLILMGDLNLEPEAESIRFLSEKLNDTKTVCKIVQEGPEGTFNGYKFDEPATRRIDYIFTSKHNVEVQSYAVLKDPIDGKYPSDHFPVLVEVVFNY